MVRPAAPTLKRSPGSSGWRDGSARRVRRPRGAGAPARRRSRLAPICVRNPGQPSARLGTPPTLPYSRARDSSGAVAAASRPLHAASEARERRYTGDHHPGRLVTHRREARAHRPRGRAGGARPGRARAHQDLPRHARGEDHGARDHVRHQHRHRRVQRDRARRRPGAAVPALPRLQPRRRHRRAGAGRGRARRHGGARQRPRPRQLRQPPGDHADTGGAAEQGRHAGHELQGLGGRLRRPRPDGPDGARHDGRGRLLLPGRAYAQPRGARARRHPDPGTRGARRPRHHQRLQRPHRHERAALLTTPTAGCARPRSPRR